MSALGDSNQPMTISNYNRLRRRKSPQEHKFYGTKKAEKRKPSEVCGTSSEHKLRLKNKK